MHTLLEVLGLSNTLTALGEATSFVKTFLTDCIAEVEKRADVTAIST